LTVVYRLLLSSYPNPMQQTIPSSLLSSGYLRSCIMKRKRGVRMKTIADIAKLAGVAKSTVSRYLNGGSISDKTKQKIERIIEETGYTPNAFAQSLKAKKTNMVGVIVPRLDSYEASQILIGIENELRLLNSQMLVSHTNQSI